MQCLRCRAGAAVFLLSCYLLSPLSGAEQEWTGEVVQVHDGDTFWMMKDASRVKVRIHGIDAPETDQEHGREARDYAKALVSGKVVHAKQVDTDKYDRPVVQITLTDGRLFDQEMVRAGFAWWNRTYAPEDRALQALELEARMTRTGLWTDPDPTPPWQWLHRKDASPDLARTTTPASALPAWMHPESQKKKRQRSRSDRTKTELRRTERRSER